MVQLPRFQQTEILEPASAPVVSGFEAVAQTAGQVVDTASKLNEQQIQTEKVIGSNQMQSSYQKLTQDAALKFPGDYAKQKAFVNAGIQQYESGYIPNTNFANRGYFKALSQNYTDNLNFSYEKKQAAQQLQQQRSLIQDQAQQSITNSSLAIRQGNDPLAKDNIGNFVNFLNNNVKGGVLSPEEAEKYKQQYLLETNLAGAKRQMDVALSAGGVDALNNKFREIITDNKNPQLVGPNSRTFISQLNSYRQASKIGLEASTAANKQQVNDILNNIRMTGQYDPQKVTQLDIPQEKINDAMDAHDTAWEIFTSSAIQRQNKVSGLDLSSPNQVSALKTYNDLNSAYNKDKMGFLLNMLGKMRANIDLANATPQQLQQLRSMAVQIQQQRGDLNVEPATQAEIQPVIQAANQASQQQNPQVLIDSLNQYKNSMGQYWQTGMIQLSKQLKKNGVNSMIEDLPYLDHTSNQFEDVSSNIVGASTSDIKATKDAAALRLGLTPQKFSSNLKVQSNNTIFPSGIFTKRSKLVDSIINGAGIQQGESLAELQSNLENYASWAVANGKAANIDEAMGQYLSAYQDSFSYMPTSNGRQIRIPNTYRNLPVDGSFVASGLKSLQGKLSYKDIDLSHVNVDPREGKTVSQVRWWNSVGSVNHWVNMPDGESFGLVAADGKLLNYKDGQPVIFHLDKIIGSQSPQNEQEMNAIQGGKE